MSEIVRDIPWERDCNDYTAVMVQSNNDGFISPSAARSIARGLMHDVSTISARFNEKGLIVFSELAGISVFGKGGGEFYGIYGSGGEVGLSDYCIRRSTWEERYGTIDDVLKGLSSRTIFFGSECLSDLQHELINKVDYPLRNEVEIFPGATKNIDLIDKEICFFVFDKEKDIFCNYACQEASSPHIESLFGDIKVTFNCLVEDGAITPLANTFRISYSFQRKSGVIFRQKERK